MSCLLHGNANKIGIQHGLRVSKWEFDRKHSFNEELCNDKITEFGTYT